MKKLTRQEKHEQCMREIRGTLIVVLINVLGILPVRFC